jgi:hypothetical protein
MHRLIAEVGWPALIVCAVLLVASLPTLVPMAVQWVRFEVELSRRARAYEAREEAARVPRVMIP